MSSSRPSSSSLKPKRSSRSSAEEKPSVPPLPLSNTSVSSPAEKSTSEEKHRRHRSSSEGKNDEGKKRRSSSSTSPSSTHGEGDRKRRSSKTDDDASVVGNDTDVASVKGDSRRHHRRSSSSSGGAHRLSSSAILRQIHRDLTLTGGIHTFLLTPGSFISVALAVLQHTLRSFSPETLVVKRVTSSGARDRSSRSHRGADDTVSEAGSRPSSRHSSHGSSRSRSRNDPQGSQAADLDTSAVSTTRYAHRRHRSTSSEQRRLHASATAVGGGASESGSVASGAPGEEEPSESPTPPLPLSRRSRASANDMRRRSASADVLPTSARTDGTDPSGKASEGDSKAIRRSRSDESRQSGSERKRRDRTSTTGGLSSSLPPSSANSSFGSNHGLSSMLAGGSHGMTGGAGTSLPPPPPMIGKPPLSGRRPAATGSSSGAPAGTPPLSPRSSSAAAAGHKDGSGSHSRHHRHRDDQSTVSAKTSAAAEGAGKASGKEPRDRRGWLAWLKEMDATKPAYLTAHILRAAPVATLHFFCELKRQLVALPMLRRCSDVGADVQTALGHVSSAGVGGGAEKDETAWLGTRFGANFLILRVLLRMWDRYIEEALFLDDSLVVRNLRSKRFSRQMVGWVLRLASHSIFDPIFLSVISPILCLCVSDFSSTSKEVKYTIPGLARGVALGCGAFLLERIMAPTVSQLVNRAVVTVCETTEYVLLRRYRMDWSDDEIEDDDDDEGDSEEDENQDAGDAESQASAATSPAVTPRGGSERKRSSSSRSAKKGKVEDTSSATVASTTGAPAPEKDAAMDAEKQARRERRKRRKEREEKKKKREERQKRRETMARRAILRAIVYRIAGGLCAQCFVEHPMGVAVEMLRGRAMMHATGLLSAYDDISRENPTTAVYMASWANVKALAKELFTNTPQAGQPAGGRANNDDDAVPVMVRLLRRIGADAGHEVTALSATVMETSGQAAPLEALTQRVTEKMAASGNARPTAKESAELLGRSLLSVTPLFYGVQFTAIDRVLGFYMAVWTRLTRG